MTDYPMTHYRCSECGGDWPESDIAIFGVTLEGNGHYVDETHWCPGPLEKVET